VVVVVGAQFGARIGKDEAVERWRRVHLVHVKGCEVMLMQS
jgi:hypothetical protein